LVGVLFAAARPDVAPVVPALAFAPAVTATALAPAENCERSRLEFIECTLVLEEDIWLYALPPA